MRDNTFDVDGCIVTDIHDPDAQVILTQAKEARVRPLCLCQPVGVPMYIAVGGTDLIIKRMPGTAAAHGHRCRSWLPPDELSGYGAVAEQSIIDNPTDGTTSLRLGFSLSKSGGRAAPEPSDTQSDTVRADGNKLSLRAVLHYLWDEAELTSWHPAFAGHRSWAVVHRRLRVALDGKLVRKCPLGPSVYVPEPFSADRKLEIEQRRIKAWAVARRVPGKSSRLLIGVGEIKSIEATSHGVKLQVRHQPGHPWFVDHDLYRKLTKRFPTELEMRQMANDDEVRLVVICTFSVSNAGYARVEELSLMTTDRHWLPFSNDADRTLLASAIEAQRSFRKVLPYNGRRTALASLIFTDTAPAVAAFIDRPMVEGDGDCMTGGLPVWNWHTDEDMPALPPIDESR